MDFSTIFWIFQRDFSNYKENSVFNFGNSKIFLKIQNAIAKKNFAIFEFLIKIHFEKKFALNDKHPYVFCYVLKFNSKAVWS